MNKDINIDINQLQQRVEQIIKEGEDLLSFANKNEKQRIIEWFEKINILNERYLKTHPSHSAIHTVYFHSNYEKDSIEEMIPKLRAVLHDEDYFSNSTKSSTEINDEHNSEQTKPAITKSSTVFISYSWDSEEHKIWVKGLADMLLSEGISVLIDQYDLNPGDRLTTFMEKSINDCDRALIICTPQYKTKADERLAGVGYESNIITADIFQKHNDLKYIPVVRSGDFNTAMPNYILGKLAVDLREENSKYEDSIQDLLATIRGETKKPPVNMTNKQNTQKMSQEALTDDTALHIVGIITDEVTLPKNYGTIGSALYSIPFRLSGYPDAKWSEYFIHCWNYPSSFTTMHRPGIASVLGNKIVLNGTTIDEVQQYHRKTLIAAVKKANEMYDQYHQKILQEKKGDEKSNHLTKHDEDVHKRISDDMERLKDMVYGDLERLDPFELDDFRFIDDLLDFLKRSANHFVDASMEELRKNLFNSIQDFRHFQAINTFHMPGTTGIYSTTFYLIESQPETSMIHNLPSILNMDPDTYKERIKPYEEISQEYRKKAKHVVKCFEELEKRYLSLVN